MDAILAQAVSSATPFIYTCTSKAAPVFICVLLKTTLAPPQSHLFVTQSLLLPISVPVAHPPPILSSTHWVGLLINSGNLCLSY